jgi:hypothetical protein
MAASVSNSALQNNNNIMADVWAGSTIPWFIGVVICSLGNSLESVLGGALLPLPRPPPDV